MRWRREVHLSERIAGGKAARVGRRELQLRVDVVEPRGERAGRESERRVLIPAAREQLHELRRNRVRAPLGPKLRTHARLDDLLAHVALCGHLLAAQLLLIRQVVRRGRRNWRAHKRREVSGAAGERKEVVYAQKQQKQEARARDNNIIICTSTEY